jgi:hypothetical protein
MTWAWAAFPFLPDDDDARLGTQDMLFFGPV